MLHLDVVKRATTAVVETLAPSGKERDQGVLDACLRGDCAAVRRMLNATSVNVALMHHLWPLHIAATAGHAHTVRALVHMGAHINQADSSPKGQNTALHFAVLARKKDAVEALLQMGANPDVANCVHTTPLHDAARMGDGAILDLLWDAGTDPTRVNIYGDNILHRAVHFGRASTVLHIVRRLDGAQRHRVFNHANTSGYNPLDIAISQKLQGLVRFLLSVGIKPSQSERHLVRKPYELASLWQKHLDNQVLGHERRRA